MEGVSTADEQAAPVEIASLERILAMTALSPIRLDSVKLGILLITIMAAASAANLYLNTINL